MSEIFDTHALLGKGLSALFYAVFTCCFLIFPVGLQAQVSQSGSTSPLTQSAALEELPLAARVARGELPPSRLYSYISVQSSLIHRLPPLSLDQMKPEEFNKKLRIGAVRPLERRVDVLSEATSYSVPEGQVGVMGIVSEGARWIRLHFTGVELPAGVRLFVYSMKNPEEIYGPYENRGPSKDGTIWTPPMEGDGAVIEYVIPAFLPPATGENFMRLESVPTISLGSVANFGGANLEVSAVSHIFADPPHVKLRKPSAEAGPCNLEVTAPWIETAKSVGHLQFTEGQGEFVCTGTLLNDLAGDFIPYLLTANHCFETQSAAQSLRVYWHYNTGDFPTGSTPHTDASNLLVTGTASDFTFVRLTGTVPGGLLYAGWDSAVTPASTNVTGIHHPHGSHKRISFGATLSDNCSGIGLPGPCANFTKVRWSSGTTEGGSSGSGIWKGASSDPRLVGSLTGGFAGCDNLSGLDYYGSFSVTYPQISQYLGATAGAAKTVGVFRPSNGIVYLKNSNSGGFADINFVYGVAGDKPIAGDWNADGVDTLGIYRNGTFYLRNSNTTGAANIVFAFGSSSDLPVAGDWNGDGIDTVGVYRPSTGVFFLRNSNSAGAADISFVLGNPGDIGIAGDWNGDGTTTTGVFRPSNGIVYLKNTNTSGFADISLVYGNAGDQPLAGDWNGDGTSTVGIYRNGVFYLRNSNTQGFADLVFALGNNGDLPIAGDWNGP